MCALPTSPRSRTARIIAALAVAAVVTSCGSPERSGSSFCRQLGEELPGIGQSMATTRDIEAMIGRWDRLLERAPLTVESDIAVVTALLRKAAAVDPSKPDQVQDLADASYEANQSAEAVRDWVLDTCAVDIATGLTVAPPRTAPPTTAAPATTVAPATTLASATTIAPATTPVPATVPAPATTVAPVTPTPAP